MEDTPSARPSYLRDPYRRHLDVEVRAIEEHGGRRYALLSDSLLFPGGGGQPPDEGRLGSALVTGAPHGERGARCEIAGDSELETGTARLRLAWPRRFDHMQQHSAQHLLTAVAADRFGWPTTSFHLHVEGAGAGACDIEIAARQLSDADLAELEEAVAAEIRAARPISDRHVPAAALESLEVRSRGLPAGHLGDVRLVEIEGLDLAACGGTHVRSTAEIESLKLLGTEPLRGGLRLAWIAGGRVRRRLGGHEKRAAELRRLFGAGDAEIAGVAGVKLDQLKQLGRQNRRLLSQVAELTAEALKASGEALVESHFDGAELAFLGQLARAVCDDGSEKAAFFTAQDERGAYLLVAAGGRARIDAQALGREAAALLDGRGGGSGRIFQGRVGSLERREQALRLLADSAALPPS